MAKIRLFFRRARAAFAETVGKDVIGDSVSSTTKLFHPPFDVLIALFVSFNSDSPRWQEYPWQEYPLSKIYTKKGPRNDEIGP